MGFAAIKEGTSPLSDISPLRAAVTPREVEAELISGLYRRTRPLLIANFGALGLLSIALWSSADRAHLAIWACTLGAWTTLRFLLSRAYLSKPRAVSDARAWTYAFACGSGVAGLLWGSSIFLIGSLEADNVKLVTAFLMAALSAAAIAGYTNSLLAFTAFVTPALLPYGVKLAWLNGEFHPIVATFILFWGWLLWSMARHLNDNFKDGIALTLQNTLLIERLSRARDRAEAASLAKTRFLANMSHELRTPLNAIIGYSEMITHRVLGPIGHPTYESYSGNVLESGRHLLRIVDRVLDISCIEAGTLELSVGQISVPDLISSAVKTVADAAEADDITITCSLAADLPELVGDASRLQQVLLDLLSNAVKFTPPNGRVDVIARARSEQSDICEETRDGLEFTVADTGVGIAPDLLAQVTTPFRQLENQDHLRRGRPLKQDIGQTDTGLGLPLARLLVERHGGKLEITSEHGRGTKVRVWLPSNKRSKADRKPHPAASEALPARSA